MKSLARASLLVLAVLVAAPWSATAQSVIAPPASLLSTAEMESFLLNGRIVATKGLPKGVTKARRVTLSHGTITHDAQVQDVDIAMPLFDAGAKAREVNFKDSYRYNIAAYRLATLLGLDNVPMSVERVVAGKRSAVTWWLDNVMDEGDRRKKKVTTTNPVRSADYYSLMYVFDELIQNRDRNIGNIVWGHDEKLWMIDHTRAFRLGKELRQPNVMTRVERAFLDRLRSLSRPELTTVVGQVLSKDEIEALFARRDLIVKWFDQRIAAAGEDTILYTMR
jgi:hypothetical protein